MYQTLYKLNADPFCLTPDPRFCLHHRSYSKAKAYLSYALQRAEGFVMVTGAPGTGKSMLIKEVINELNPARFTIAGLNSTQVTANELLRLITYTFEIPNEGTDKGGQIHLLRTYFTKQRSAGKSVLLFVDEAQDLAMDALEELRLLTNLESGGLPLLQILLIGQQQLVDLVRSPLMDQLRQRIIAASQLQALDAMQTEEYIYFRLRVAGWQQDPIIHNSVIQEIYNYTQGIPRLINQLCSRLFLHGFVSNKHEFEHGDILDAIDELNYENLSPAYPANSFIDHVKDQTSLIYSPEPHTKKTWAN